MKRTYLIDSENINEIWVELLEALEDKDDIMVFYTDKSAHMGYDKIIRLMEQKKGTLKWIKCFEGQNALDFQLVTELGYRISEEPKKEYVIVSNDTGYDVVVRYWMQRDCKVRRIRGVECERIVSDRHAELERERRAAERERQRAEAEEAKLRREKECREAGRAAEMQSQDEQSGDIAGEMRRKKDGRSAGAPVRTAGAHKRAKSRILDDGVEIEQISALELMEAEDRFGMKILTEEPYELRMHSLREDGFREKAQPEAAEQGQEHIKKAQEKEEQAKEEQAKEAPIKPEPAETEDRKPEPDNQSGRKTEQKKAEDRKPAPSVWKKQMGEIFREAGSRNPENDVDFLSSLCRTVKVSNMSLMHNMLEYQFGQLAGNGIYRLLKSSPGCRLELSAGYMNSKKQREREYLRLVLKRNGMSETDVDVIWKMISGVPKKNMNMIHTGLVKKFGQEQGGRYYAALRSHIKIIRGL